MTFLKYKQQLLFVEQILLIWLDFLVGGDEAVALWGSINCYRRSPFPHSLCLPPFSLIPQISAITLMALSKLLLQLSHPPQCWKNSTPGLATASKRMPPPKEFPPRRASSFTNLPRMMQFLILAFISGNYQKCPLVYLNGREKVGEIRVHRIRITSYACNQYSTNFIRS